VQKTQPLDALAQLAAILDQVGSLAVGIDLLKPHCPVAVYARHEIHQRTLIVVHAFSRRTPLNFFTLFFTAMNSPDVLSRLVMLACPRPPL
jgi:hypothetical protein